MIGIMNHVLRTATRRIAAPGPTPHQREDRLRHEDRLRRVEEEKELLRQLRYRRPGL